jgi:hypothetical protein
MVGGGAVAELSSVLPRVLIVSSRTVRKNKFVNFVGELLSLSLSIYLSIFLLIFLQSPGLSMLRSQD